MKLELQHDKPENTVLTVDGTPLYSIETKGELPPVLQLNG